MEFMTAGVPPKRNGYTSQVNTKNDLTVMTDLVSETFSPTDQDILVSEYRTAIYNREVRICKHGINYIDLDGDKRCSSLTYIR